jgi:hypothetical protein
VSTVTIVTPLKNSEEFGMKRSTLFRFSSTGPVKSQPQPSSERVILFDNEQTQQSHFLNNLAIGSDYRSTKEHILNRVDSFNNLLSVDVITTSFPRLLALFDEISNPIYDESFSLLESTQDIPAIIPLSSAEKTVLLDNLMARLYERRLVPEIELIQNILKADHFLAIYRAANTDDDPKKLKQARAAKIVLPLSLVNQYPEESNSQQIDEAVKVLMERAHDTVVAKHLVLELDNTLVEWDKSLTLLQKERSSSTLSASNSLSANIAASRTERINALTVKETLSSAAIKVLQNVLHKDDDDPEDIEESLNTTKDDLLKIADRPIIKSDAQTLFIDGAMIEQESEIIDGSITVKPQKVAEGLFDFYLSYAYTKPQSRIRNITGRIQQDSVSQAINSQINSSKEKGFQLFKLNNEALPYPEADIELSFTLNDTQATRHSLSPFSTFEGIPYVDIDPNPFDDDISNDLYIPPPPFYGLNRIGIMNYYRVEQELTCYTLGLVSHIENILARQFKERLSRELTRVNNEIEQESSFEVSSKSDTETTTKNEMESELENSIQQQIQHSVDVNSSMGWEASSLLGGANVNISAGYAYNNDTTTSNAERYAYSFAKEVTERIEHNINQKKRSLKKTTYTNEFEVNNKHGFDNREGSEHVVGIYRWLEKIYTNYLVNYGKKMVYEFTIPDPAKDFRHAIKKQNELDDFSFKKPRSLKQEGISSYADITPDNYEEIASQYGVYIQSPPERKLFINRSYAHSVDEYPTHADEVQAADYTFSEKLEPIVIPEGYYAAKVYVRPNYWAPLAGDYTYRIYVGDRINAFEWAKFNKKITESLDVVLFGQNISDITFSVTLKCKLKSSVMQDWKLQAYNKLMQAYDEHLAIYNEKLAEYEQKLEKSSKIKVKGGFQESLMKTELKKACIQMMVKPWGVQIGANHYKEENGYYELQLSEKLDLDSQYVKFLEQAFDWELMTAIFYPYFYARKEQWHTRMLDNTAGKQNFKAFLNAGWSRVELPVRNGFEAAVTFFFQTGEVFSGKDMVTASDDNLYVSIADELTETEPVQIERSWKSKIPTNLTILQSNASALNIDGLPCEIVDDRLATGHSQLGPTSNPDDANDN